MSADLLLYKKHITEKIFFQYKFSSVYTPWLTSKYGQIQDHIRGLQVSMFAMPVSIHPVSLHGRIACDKLSLLPPQQASFFLQ